MVIYGLWLPNPEQDRERIFFFLWPPIIVYMCTVFLCNFMDCPACYIAVVYLRGGLRSSGHQMQEAKCLFCPLLQVAADHLLLWDNRSQQSISLWGYISQQILKGHRTLPCGDEDTGRFSRKSPGVNSILVLI